MKKKNAQFSMFVGPMFGSKTSSMLLRLERYKHQHKTIVAFKPTEDVRYSQSDITTHGGWSYPAISVSTGVDIIEHLAGLEKQPDVIAVDEAFMIHGAAEVLVWLYRNGINIVVASIDMSSQGKPFAEIEKMLPWATEIVKCSAVCTVCGEDAYYTYKKQTTEVEIQVGGSELYEPRCACCHPLIMNQN